MLRLIDIAEGTSVDGPGLRTSIYFAGCKHQCEGCHNPQTWDFQAGKEWQEDDLMNVIRENDFNVTFTGGDPLYQMADLIPLAKRIKEELGKNIWCYTGFSWETLILNSQFLELAQYLDVVVDGPFILKQRDISLLFKGSSNQRLIQVQHSLQTGEIQLWK